jgi:hypothetical protein
VQLKASGSNFARMGSKSASKDPYTIRDMSGRVPADVAATTISRAHGVADSSVRIHTFGCQMLVACMLSAAGP